MTTISSTTQPKTKINLVQQYPLVAFFVLAIGLTWLFMIPDALGSHGLLTFRLPLPLMVVMGYMPTAAAVIVTALTQGREGVRALFRKLLVTRVGLRWYLFAIFGLAGLYLATIAVYNRLGFSPQLPILSPNTPPFSGPFQFVINIALLFLVVGIINGEELAWRGFALPRLQARYSALTSSLILGVIWTLFHLPLFFTLTGSSQTDWSFTSFTISTLGMTVLYTWLFNNTRGSVLLAYIFHAAANTWSQVFSVDHANQPVNWILTGMIVLTAIIVLAVTGSENLSRSADRVRE